MTPDEFTDTFDYRRGSLIDGIRYTTVGDCDDYAWTLLCLVEGGQLNALQALATGRAELWRVRSPVNGKIARHVALWHRDYGWSDTTYPEWRDHVYPHIRVREMRLITTLPLILWGKLPVKVAVVSWMAWWNWPYAVAIARGWW